MRNFLTVAEKLHFRKAAEILHLSQPTLTLQIRQMEEEIGARLFERTSRKVSLTPAGMALVERARMLLQDMDSAILHTQRVSKGIEGSLSLVYVGTGASAILARIILALQTKMPHIDLVLNDCRPAEQMQRLIEGRADLGLMHTRIEDEQLESKVVQRDGLLAAVPANFPGTGAIDLRELATRTLIVPRPMEDHSVGIYESIYSAFSRTCTLPKHVLHANLLNGLMLVAAGVGVSIVPAFLAETQMHNISFRPLLNVPATLELYAVWRRDNTSGVLKRVLRLLNGIRTQEGKKARGDRYQK